MKTGEAKAIGFLNEAVRTVAICGFSFLALERWPKEATVGLIALGIVYLALYLWYLFWRPFWAAYRG